MDEERMDFEITGDSSSLQEAVQGAIQSLDSYENKLQSITSSVDFSQTLSGLSQVSAQITATFTAMSQASASMPTVDYTGMETLSTSASNANTSLSTVGQTLESIEMQFNSMTGSFEPILGQMQSMSDKAESVASTVDGSNSEVEAAFRRVQEAIDDTSAAIAEEGKSMSDSTSALDDHVEGVEEARKAEREKGAESEKLAATLNKEFAIFQAIGKIAKQVGSFVVKAGKQMVNAWSNVHKASSAVGKGLQTLSGIAGGISLSEGINEAIAYMEAMNLYAVAVGKSVEVTDTFINKAAEMYGLPYRNLYNAVGTFANLATSLDVTSDAAAHLSMGMTKLSLDLSSLFNLDSEKVFENMSSGLQGMTRAVRKYGMDIRNVSLQQTAYNLGIKENVATMSEANRVVLRYLTMLNQARNATGDLAKQLESPAVQLKVFRDQIQETGRAIGNFFIVPLAAALPYINGFVMAIKEILMVLATLVGFKAPQPAQFAKDAAEGVAGIGSSAKGAEKAMKKLLAPFDELNIMQEQTSKKDDGGGMGVDLDPRLLDALMSTNTAFEEVRMKALDVRDSLLSFFGFEWTDMFNPDTGEWERRLEFLPDKLKEKMDFTELGQTISTGVTNAFKNAEDIINGYPWGALGSRLASLFSAIIGDEAMWSQIGSTLGSSFNAVLHLLNTFLAEFNWVQLGMNLSAGINSLVSTVEWESIGEFLKLRMLAMLTVLYTVFTEVDWGAIGLSFATLLNSSLASPELWTNIGGTLAAGINAAVDFLFDFINNFQWVGFGQAVGKGFSKFIHDVDWAKLGKTVGDLLIGALITIKEFIKNVDWVALGEAIMEFINGIDWVRLLTELMNIGIYLIEGILKGIAAMMTGLETLLYNIFIKPFIDLFKYLFGIHSPSTVMAELGTFLIEGLLQGIESLKENVFTFFKGLWDGIKAVFAFVGTWFAEVFQNTVTGIKTVFAPIGTFFSTTWTGIKNTFSVVGDVLKGFFTSAWTGIKGVVNTWGGFFQGIWTGIKNVFSNVSTWFKDTFSAAWEAVKNVFSAGGEIFDGIKDGILEGLKTVINAIIIGINKVIKVPFDGINSAFGTLRNIDILGVKPFGWIRTFNVPQIPELATGGIVRSPTQALIGEAGPEAVVPLSRDMGLLDPVVEVLEFTNALLTEMLDAIKTSGDKPVVIDKNALTDTVISGINKRARRTGRSVLET